MKKFDLNIETILDNWCVYHAIRELIANAIDEQLLSNSKPIEIYKENNVWHIRDYGRGISYFHLTQNENVEKLKNPETIGKFGIGLKDALATLDRNGVEVTIFSKHGTITTDKSVKKDFEDIATLHAIINDAIDQNFKGTDIVLKNVEEIEIEKAKQLFLVYTNEEIIETTKYGQIVKTSSIGNIYINGVKVAEEENFLFSYNITSISSTIKKAINRERSNVGRTAYSDTVKKIILNSQSKEVAIILQEDMLRIDTGRLHDELKWIDVQEHAVKILNSDDKVLFVRTKEIINSPDLINHAKMNGLKIINISDALADKIRNQTDLQGNPINDIYNFINECNSNFEYSFVDIENLSVLEKKIYSYTERLVSLTGCKIDDYMVKIADSLEKNCDFYQTKGVWDRTLNSIIIKRSELSSIRSYAEVLIHELIHAETGFSDVTREFENVLSETIGNLCELIIVKDDVIHNSKKKVSKDIDKEEVAKETNGFVRIEVVNDFEEFDFKKHYLIYQKLIIQLDFDYLKSFLFFYVITPFMSESIYNEFKKFMPHTDSYEDYVLTVTKCRWIRNIPAIFSNMKLLFKQKFKTEKEYDELSDYFYLPYKDYCAMYTYIELNLDKIDKILYYDMKTTFYKKTNSNILPIRFSLDNLFNEYNIVVNAIKKCER